jgi:uncharacterized protein (DUF302 family)
MSYYFTTQINGNFNTVLENITAASKKEGFGILTTIDMQRTLKNKLDVNFKKYTILGACNPQFAYKALQVENKIGAMLPCNIILQENENNSIEVSAINPMVSMQSVKNRQLNGIAEEVSNKLQNVIKNIQNEK